MEKALFDGGRLMEERALVDTCILVYLIDRTEGEKHLKAREWFKAIKQRESLFVSIQNLREFSSIALKKSKLNPSEINEFLRVFSDAFGLVFDCLEDVVQANLLVGKNRKAFWDALLAATMKSHSIGVILTENTKDFSKFKGIEAKNPLL